MLKRKPTQSDLTSPHVPDMETWVQLHNIPAGTITGEGIQLLATDLGTPMTEPTASFIDGNKYYKIKVLMPMEKPIKEKLRITHQQIGTITIHVVYERLSKICLFCAGLGHEHPDCVDKIRMEGLARDLKYANQPGMQGITDLKLNPWINNVALVPKMGAQSPLRRSGSSEPVPTGPTNGVNDTPRPNTAGSSKHEKAYGV